jgi:5-methylcytosine-specific restriction endonuclease McrA
MGDKNPQTKMRGEKSPFWKKDKKTEERLYERKYYEYHKWRRSVYERDNYICQECFKKMENGLHVHHKDANKLNIKENNLISLCPSCHAKETMKRKKGVLNG